MYYRVSLLSSCVSCISPCDVHQFPNKKYLEIDANLCIYQIYISVS